MPRLLVVHHTPSPALQAVLEAVKEGVALAEGTELGAVRRMAAALRPGGLLVSGWRTDLLTRAGYDALAADAGLTPVARYSTWQAEPWRDDADWCVAVDRRLAD